MKSGKNTNKQWSDIWIEKDGIHMLKIAYESLFNSKYTQTKTIVPEYILKDGLVIKWDNIEKLRKLDYKNKYVVLATLKDTDVKVEVPIKSMEEKIIVKNKLSFRTVGTKRKILALAACAVAIAYLTTINYDRLFYKLSESFNHVNLSVATTKTK